MRSYPIKYATRRPTLACHCLLAIALFGNPLFAPITACAEALVKVSDATHLSISLRSAPNIQDQDKLVVELDGHDASAFATLSDNRIEIRLDAQLSSGDHELVIMLFKADGEILTLEEESFSLYALPGIKRSQLQHNLTLQTSYRLDEHNGDFDDIPHSAAQGGTRFSANLETDKWLINAEAEAIYDRFSDNNPTANEWELPHYRLQLTRNTATKQLGATLGVVDLKRSGLMINDFLRRGLALSAANGRNYGISIFGLQSEQQTAYNTNLAYPGDENERTLGATAWFTPFSEHPQKLRITAEYLDGNTSLGGSGVQVDDSITVYGGHAWNFVADSYWRQGSIWLQGEFSEAQFDSDGLKTGEDSTSDQAHNLFIEFNSDGDLRIPGLDTWKLAAQQREVGRHYYSVGNITLPGDLELNRAYLQIAKGGLTLDAEWTEEKNNLDNDPDIARQRTQHRGFSFTYLPMLSESPSAIWNTLGEPSVSGHYFSSLQSQPRSDSLRLGYDLDTRVEEYSLSISFSQDAWNWAIQHTLIDTDDRSIPIIVNDDLLYEPQADNKDRLTQLQFGWTLHQRLSINSYLQWNKLTESGTRQTNKSRNFGLDTQLELLTDRLFLNAGYNLTKDEAKFSMSEFDTRNKNQTAHFALSWNAVRGNGTLPDITLSLDGSYAELSDRILDSDDRTWQLFLNFDLQWSGGSGQ